MGSRIWRLPETPEELKHNYPEVYDFAYSGGGPVKCQVNHVHLELLRGGNWMRMGKKVSGGSGPSSSSSTQDAMQQQVQQCVMGVFQQLLQPMMMGDQRVTPLQRLVQRVNVGDGNLQGLRMLGGPEISPLRRAQTIMDAEGSGVEPTAPALPEPAAALATQQPPMPPPAAPPAPPGPNAPLEKQEETPLPDARPQKRPREKDSVADATTSVLKALASRDAAKAEKAAAKKEEKAALLAMKSDKETKTAKGVKKDTKAIGDISMSHEKSRFQFLVRATGDKSKVFAYKKEKPKASDIEAARKSACLFIKEWCEKRGKAVPKQYRS